MPSGVCSAIFLNSLVNLPAEKNGKSDLFWRWRKSGSQIESNGSLRHVKTDAGMVSVSGKQFHALGLVYRLTHTPNTFTNSNMTPMKTLSRPRMELPKFPLTFNKSFGISNLWFQPFQNQLDGIWLQAFVVWERNSQKFGAWNSKIC